MARRAYSAERSNNISPTANAVGDFFDGLADQRNNGHRHLSP